MTERLKGVFNIYPGEERLVTFVLAYAILLFSANVFSLTANMGLFFETYDAATLPYTYVLLMVTGPLVSLFYLRFSSRFTFARSLLGVHAFLLLSLILLPLILNWNAAPILRLVLPVFQEINAILIYASFWNLLGRLYNLRQGKRLFPLLNSGEHLATIGAGFMATFFVARFGTTSLYWISALFMAGAIAFLVGISRAKSNMLEKTPGDDGEQGRPSGLKALAKEPYVRLLFTIVTFYTLSVFMVENLSYIRAEIRFPSAEGMATYVGIFMAIYGFLGLLVQWFVAGRFLNRFGVTATLLALPGGIFLFIFIFTLVGSFNAAAAALFWLAAGANMYAYIFDAPYTAARNIILQPLPAHVRIQAQTAVMGIAYPLATGIAGLLLLLLLNGLGFESVQLAYAILVVLAFWLAAGVLMGRAYAHRLRQVLQARSLGQFGFFPSLDRSSKSVLQEVLQSPHPAAVLYALNILAKVAPETLTEHLPGLLKNPDGEVRLAALACITRLSWLEASPGVRALLENDPNDAVRAAALRTWYAIEPQLASEQLAQLAHNPQLPVRQASLAILYRHDHPHLRQQGAEALHDLVSSAEAEERILVAGVLGEVGAREEDAPLFLKLLVDANLRVQQAALAAAVSARLPAIWPAILPFLADQRMKSQAVEALVAGGEAALPLLQAACLSPGQEARILAGIAQTCGRIAVPEAITILEGLLDHPDTYVRHETLLGLSGCAYQVAPQEQEAINERLSSQAAELVALTAAQVDIGDAPQVHLLAAALEQERMMGTDNLLLLLSFLDEPQTILSAREALQPGHNDEERRAYALEVLDILLTHEYKTFLFPFLGRLNPRERLAAMQKQFPQALLGRTRRLQTYVTAAVPEGDRWTRICAIYALGLLERKRAAEAVIAAAVRFRDDSALVETALNSLIQLDVSLEALAAANPPLEGAISRWRARDPQARTLLQKVESFKQVNLFANLPNDVLEGLAGLANTITIKAKETIIAKGAPGDHLYVVMDGRLRVHDGDHTFATLAAGGVVGEMALLDDEPRSASVSAETNSYLLQLDQTSFYNLLAGYPQVARELLTLLSKRLRKRSAEWVPGAGQEPMQPLLRLGTGRPRGGVAVQSELLDLDKLLILKRIPFFSAISDDLGGQVAMLLQGVDLANGEVLFQQGDPGRSLYIVARGQVRIHIEARTLAYASEGEIIGEMALLEAEPRSATVTAVVPTQLLQLDQEPFFELIDAQPELARGLIKMLSGRQRARLELMAGGPEETGFKELL